MATVDPGEAIYRAICRRSPATEPQTFNQAVGWFIANAGGNLSAAARAAGVPRRTFRDWTEGKGHGTARAGAVLAAARAGERRARLRPGREKRLRRADPGAVVVRGRYNYDEGRGGVRVAQVGRYAGPSLIDDVLDAFLSGATLAELREVFAGGITGDATDFYPQTLGNPTSSAHGWDVTGIDLEGTQDADE